MNLYQTDLQQNKLEVMFCYIDNDEIVMLDDSEELNDVMNELAKEGYKYLKELELNKK